MKAKDWYNKFAECKTEEEFTTSIENCIKSLSDEVKDLIRVRGAKSNKAVAKCIEQVNDKWIAICNLHDNNLSKLNDPFLSAKLLKDGFKAGFVKLNPKMGWYFDLPKHKKYIEQEEEKILFPNLTNATFKLFGLTPYEEITKENITMEILSSMYALGRYGTPTTSKTLLKIVADRITILRYWKETGVINLEDVKEMEKDPRKLFTR